MKKVANGLERKLGHYWYKKAKKHICWCTDCLKMTETVKIAINPQYKQTRTSSADFYRHHYLL